MSPHRQGLGAVFAIPLILAILSLIGLVGALLEDGGWDLAGAGLLATCVIAVGWARWRRHRPSRSPGRDKSVTAEDSLPTPIVFPSEPRASAVSGNRQP